MFKAGFTYGLVWAAAQGLEGLPSYNIFNFFIDTGMNTRNEGSPNYFSTGAY